MTTIKDGRIAVLFLFGVRDVGAWIGKPCAYRGAGEGFDSAGNAVKTIGNVVEKRSFL